MTHTEVIGILLKTHQAYLSTVAAEEIPMIKTIKDFLSSYSHYLTQTYQTHKSQWEEEFQNDFSILLGGDRLHLSSTYREEHVTAWLKWILEAPPLGQEEKYKLLNNFLHALANSRICQEHCESGQGDFQLATPISLKTEIWLDRKSRLDLVIESKDTVILIENKIGDLSLEKNKRYRKLADERWPRKKRIAFLLIPQESLEEFLSSNHENETSEILKAFPPVTWEALLKALRDLVGRFESQSPVYLLWKANVCSFLSFIEGNVLCYDLGKIRNVFLNDIEPDSATISEFVRYSQYRKGE